ncbi:uncharacterized protein odam [Eucyclogobius newberryi]|uniref:uncharacterized protein odam n=1 Tax=Eucyclogobius newberryi TaxID=166745 RepID=UPI003B5A257D
MKSQVAVLLVCLLRTSFGIPVQFGILASNSNEIFRLNTLNTLNGLNGLNGLTFTTLGQAQASSLLPPFVLQQQQPEVLLTPQMVNLNPQFAGPFGPQGPQVLLPSQGNQLNPVILPNGQQDQLGPQDPNNPNVPPQAQNPAQMYPQYQYPAYGYPQLTRQGFPYFFPRYGYAQQRNTAPLQPNNGQVQQPNPNLDRTTQRPQLPLQQASQPKVPSDSTWPLGTNKESTTLTPELRGDASGPGVDEGNSNFPFLFEP